MIISSKKLRYVEWIKSNINFRLSDWLFGNSCNYMNHVWLHIIGTNEQKSAKKARQGT